MTIDQLIAHARSKLSEKLTARATYTAAIEAVRTACLGEQRDPNDAEATSVREAQEARAALDAEIVAIQTQVADLEREKAADEAAARLAREVTPSGVIPPAGPPAPVARVGAEARTYRADTDTKGVQFLRDVAASHFGIDLGARERLARHMQEEQVERQGQLVDRATGTGAFAGLVVPQYLTDLMAPLARAGRPFADACRHHDLPPQGMVANISKITTGSNVDNQSAENANVAEQDIDDTLLSIPVQTAAGQQTVSRQGLERGTGVEDTTLEDLFRAYAANLDAKLLNQAGTGLTNVATPITYTDATPTATELYPKLVQGAANVEAALLDQHPGDTIAVMHSRRWYWLQSQLTSTWPMFGQPNIGSQHAGVNYGERYGSGFRGVLPCGCPVVVDNNIGTAFGAGTNEDEAYFVAQSEAHLWEDPNAPMLIRAEQTKAASLGVLLVVYGYYAYTFTRRTHAQKLSGTGMAAPTF